MTWRKFMQKNPKKNKDNNELEWPSIGSLVCVHPGVSLKKEEIEDETGLCTTAEEVFGIVVEHYPASFIEEYDVYVEPELEIQIDTGNYRVTPLTMSDSEYGITEQYFPVKLIQE